MALDIVLAILAVLALLGLIWLVIKKFPVVKMIDTGRLANLNQQQVKTNIADARLRRKLVAWGSKLQNISRPLTQVVKKYSSDLGQKIQGLEDNLKQKLVQQTEAVKPLEDLLKQAKEAAGREDWEAAERLYLEIIRQSPREVRAYEGLGDLYLAQHDFESAQELFTYLVSHHSSTTWYHVGLARSLTGQGQLEQAKKEYLNYLAQPNNGSSQIYFELGQLHKDLGQLKEAWESIYQARQRESGNPRILDFFIEISIVNERPTDAQSALDNLKQVNPENKKISQFDKAIRELVEKLKPKLRVVSQRISLGQPLTRSTTKSAKKRKRTS
ncbi:MAG: tetratricopeptide repeat protein [Patescibacteria group bacterium]